jgi:hypothetical protein
MDQFLEIAFSLPTVLFTVGLGLAALYWVFVIVGALDLDVFGVDGVADGAADGAADGLVGGGLEGAHGAHEGAHELAHEGHEGFLVGILSVLRLRKAPVTVVLSVLLLFAWILSFVGMEFLEPAGLMPRWALSVLVALGALLVGLGLTSVAVRPLAGVFETHTWRGQETLVGKECVIVTQDVTERHGQATLDQGGTSLVLTVVCGRQNGLTRGARALIIDYDKARHVYHVEPLDELLAEREPAQRGGAQAAREVEAQRRAGA